MKALITNKLLVIKDPTNRVKTFVKDTLSYRDKSKIYELKRRSKQPLFKFTSEYKELKEQCSGEMYKELPGGHLVMSAGFAYICDAYNIPVERDDRCETGKNIALPWKDKPFSPRPYQQESIDLMIDNYRGLINLATGLGKTLTAVHAIRAIGKKTLIVVPGESIAKQFVDELRKCFGKNRVEMFGAGRKKTADITVGIAASVVKNTEKFQEEELGLIIFDEVHHIAAKTFFDISRDLGDVGKLFGLTATDFRSDGKDIMITAGCGNVLIKRDLGWGIQNGWLAKPEFVMKNVETLGKNYKNDKLKNYREHVLKDQAMKEAIEEDIQSALDNGESVLILVDQVAHGKEISDRFGIPFATSSDKKSQEYVNQLNQGSIPGLVGTDGKVGEGTDTKNVDVLIMANFVAGKGAIYQCVGRGTRIHNNKKTVRIHDYRPKGSDMLSRHADIRLSIYKNITPNVIEVN